MNKILFRILRFSGIPILFRELIQRKRVSILLFHDLKAETAEKNFNYLTKKYNVICLNDLIYAINKKDFSTIPKKALIITFDDGHIRNYEMLPIIKKTKVPITIFLCAGLINTNRHFWFKHKHNSISTSELKLVPNEKRLELLSKVGFKQDKEFESPQAIQKQQIDEMVPFVNMQSHTLFHPILPKCKYNVAKSEIVHSKEILEDNYGLNINAISYPNGDYSDRDIEFSKGSGYKCGITVDYGFNSANTDPFRLKRISVNDTDDLNELIVKASGFWAFIKTRNGLKQEFGHTKITE
jgi:peptidoglycan/xylan/chitin deacetylase (PgdA/CDA1 family)